MKVILAILFSLLVLSVKSQPTIDNFKVVISGYVLNGDTVMYKLPREIKYQTKKELRNKNNQFDYVVTKGDVKVTYKAKIKKKHNGTIKSVYFIFHPMTNYVQGHWMVWTSNNVKGHFLSMNGCEMNVRMRSFEYEIENLVIFMKYDW